MSDFTGLFNDEDSQDPISVKSRTGYVIILGDCPLVWASKLQQEISLSTVEAEYVALSQSMRELIPLRELLKEIHYKMGMRFSSRTVTRSTVFEDNNGAITLAKTPRLTPRTKHIATKYHWFRSKLVDENGNIEIDISRVETENQLADCFTKGLDSVKFVKLRKLLLGW